MEIIDEMRAPGRKVMRRSNGRVDVYWVASPAAVKAGYEAKTRPLKDDPGDREAPPHIAALCRQWWAEMLEYLAGRRAPGGSSSVGTVAWLIDQYERDEESPYQRIRQATKIGYDKSLAIIRSTVGERRIDAITSKDVWRWFKKWGRADDEGALKNPRRAYGCIQMLRLVVKHGKGLRLAGCRELAEILSETEFPIPKGRDAAMTAAHVAAFIPKARELGYPSLALAVALQFCCSLRQKDVIGEWIGNRWEWGLRWGEHIDPNTLMLTKPTSKSKGKQIAEFDLKLLPIVMQEIGKMTTDRVGYVIFDENTKKPYRQREFARRFRTIARAAGIPDEIWNMDARAGAITEAYNVGARETDAMSLATHTQLSTSLRYKRSKLASTNRVSVLRFGGKDD